MPHKVLIVTTILCLLSGGLGYWLGKLDADLSETDLIDAAAALWSSETGDPDASACVAWAPSESTVWLEVRCGMDRNERIYRFDERGALMRRSGPST